MTRAIIGHGQPTGNVAHIDMSTRLSHLDLNAPVLTASGCAASGKELDAFFDITKLGAIVTKSIQLKPRSGRATPRMVETPSGMLNSIGLQGPGIDAFIEQDLQWLSDRGARIVVSIAGGTTDEYVKLASRLRSTGLVDAIEVNISCPNVASRGEVFACRADSAADVVLGVRRNTDSRTPVFAKLSPDVTDITEIAHSVVNAGADGLTIMNTTLGMSIDVDTGRPRLAGVTGGLSGPAIRPIAIRCVWQVRQALPNIPIIGVGGIGSGRDALEFVYAGANAVAVGTMTFHDPSAPLRIQDELEAELIARGFTSLSSAIGYAHRPEDLIDEVEEFDVFEDES